MSIINTDCLSMNTLRYPPRCSHAVDAVAQLECHRVWNNEQKYAIIMSTGKYTAADHDFLTFNNYNEKTELHNDWLSRLGTSGTT